LIERLIEAHEAFCMGVRVGDALRRHDDAKASAMARVRCA
jgi:hypothetical protein